MGLKDPHTHTHTLITEGNPPISILTNNCLNEEYG